MAVWYCCEPRIYPVASVSSFPNNTDDTTKYAHHPLCIMDFHAQPRMRLLPILGFTHTTSFDLECQQLPKKLQSVTPVAQFGGQILRGNVMPHRV